MLDGEPGLVGQPNVANPSWIDSQTSKPAYGAAVEKTFSISGFRRR